MLLATRHSACRAKVSAINQLKALVVGAPEELRAELRGLGTSGRFAAAPGCGSGRLGRWSTA
jgi:transposase